MSALSSTLSSLAKRSLPVSTEFNELVRGIGESKSKGEEDAIVSRMLEICRAKIKGGRRDPRSSKDFLIYVIYIDMLGHDTRWAHATVVQLCSEKSLVVKKARGCMVGWEVAYLAASLLLPPGSDLGLMLTATIQADLSSDNWLVVASALQAACRAATPELVSAFLPRVTALLGHSVPGVARRALLALQRFLQLDPGAAEDLGRTLVERLGHREPALMAASLAGLRELVAADPVQYQALARYLVAILKQAYEGKLGRGFEVRRASAPFLQMELLRLLRMLGAGNPGVSADVASVVVEAQRRAETLGSPLGAAVALECLRTRAALSTPAADPAGAADAAARMLSSSDPNARLVGVDVLARLVSAVPERVAAAQLGIVDCLRSQDGTLVRATLGLLFRMADAGNVGVVAREVLTYLQAGRGGGGAAGGGSGAARGSVTAQLLGMAERLAPTHAWYVATAAEALEAAGEDAPPGAGDALAAAVAEGGESESEHRAAVDELLERLDAPRAPPRRGEEEGGGDGDEAARAAAPPPPQLLAAAAWVAGEYGGESTRGVAGAVDALCALRETHAPGPTVLAAAAGALGKLGVQSGAPLPRDATAFLEAAARSADRGLQQRAVHVLATLRASRSVQVAALPHDSAAQDVEVDPTLSFLDAYVQETEQSGAAPYLSAADRASLGLGPAGLDGLYPPPPHRGGSGTLNFTAYERAAVPAPRAAERAAASPQQPQEQPQQQREEGGTTGVPPLQPHAAAAPPAAQLLVTRGGGGRKWGAEAAAPPPAAAVAASPLAQQQHSSSGHWSPRSEATGRASPAAEASVDPARAQLAASLFGGGGGATAAAGAPRSAARERRGAGSALAPPPPPAPEVDLLGGFLDESPAFPPQRAQAAAPPSATLGDALDGSLLDLGPAPGSGPAAVPADPFGLLQDLGPGLAAPTPLFDAFGGVGTGPLPSPSLAFPGSLPLGQQGPGMASPPAGPGALRQSPGAGMKPPTRASPAKPASDPFADLLS